MGRNALDGAVLGYMNVAALRQHIRPDERIHGIFTRSGDKPNIVPHEAAAEWYVRSPKLDSLAELRARWWPAWKPAPPPPESRSSASARRRSTPT